MGWPQYVAIVWLVLSTVAGIYRSVKISDTPGQGTTFVLVDLARVVTVVLVLSAGGFW